MTDIEWEQTTSQRFDAIVAEMQQHVQLGDDFRAKRKVVDRPAEAGDIPKVVTELYVEELRFTVWIWRHPGGNSDECDRMQIYLRIPPRGLPNDPKAALAGLNSCLDLGVCPWNADAGWFDDLRVVFPFDDLTARSLQSILNTMAHAAERLLNDPRLKSSPEC